MDGTVVRAPKAMLRSQNEGEGTHWLPNNKLVPITISLHIACLVILFTGEMAVEISSGIEHVTQTHIATVTRYGIAECDGNNWKQENRLFERATIICSMINFTDVVVWGRPA